MKKLKRHILLVDDDKEDKALIKEILASQNLDIRISDASDGVDAIEFLTNKKELINELPELILLDINMPRKNGHDTLTELKKDEILSRIPVIMLTSSGSQEDIIRSYSTGASCYMVKPRGLEEFHSVVESLRNFWFLQVKFPYQSSN